MAGLEVEGLYGLLRGGNVSSASPPHKKAHHTPSTTVSNLPPQESTGPEISCPTVDISKQVPGVASPAVPPASEETLSANMQPLCIQLGVLSQCIDAR